jgi:DNA-binding MarR family transcriptional regulator
MFHLKPEDRMAQDFQPHGSQGNGDAPLLSPLDDLLGYQLRRASLVMMSALHQALVPFGLSAGEASLLIIVDANPGCAQPAVCRTLAIKSANMAPLVARLKARGLLITAPIDGRSRSLRLTSEGTVLVERLLRKIAAVEQRFASRLAADDAQYIGNALAKLIRG